MSEDSSDIKIKNDKEDNKDTAKKSSDEGKDSMFIIVGIIAGIVIWIVTWQLAELYLNNRDKTTQTIVYVTSIIVSFIALYWLGKRHPNDIGFSH